MTATGLCCLRVGLLAGHPGHSRVTIGGIADRGTTGHRIWFFSTRSAERTIAELHRTHGERRGDGLVIEAATGEAYRLLRGSAWLIGVAVMDDEQVDAKMASLTTRIETTIKALGRKGTMKSLLGVLDHDLTGLLART